MEKASPLVLLRRSAFPTATLGALPEEEGEEVAGRKARLQMLSREADAFPGGRLGEPGAFVGVARLVWCRSKWGT